MATGELESILLNSDKKVMLEKFSKELERVDKVVIILIEHEKDEAGKCIGKYNSLVLTLGIDAGYEALGIIEAGKNDLVNSAY